MAIPARVQSGAGRAAEAGGFAAWLVRDRDGLRKGERTRLDLMGAAARFLATGPLERLTVSAICKASGVAHGTFYLYFPDRHALSAEVLGAFVDFVQIRMRAAARLPGDAARNTTAAYIDTFEENAGLMKCLVAGVDAFPEARAAFQRLNHHWVRTVVEAALRRQGGAARSEADLLRRAYALGGMVDQYLIALFVTGDPWVAELSQDREALLDMFTDLWKRGMAP